MEALRTLGWALALAVVSAASHAQVGDYPIKPIRLTTR